MQRKITHKVTGKPAVDGAGVQLVRVLGRDTIEAFDPILMLDSFDSINPDDYTAGFPMHPHRGIETISYVYKGRMVHKDTLGNEDEISDGGVQWMNSGSGILHEEQVPEADRLLGVQLWLNLPKDEKMSKPSYHPIRSSEIPEIEFEGGMLRLLSGKYKEQKGHQSNHLPFDYYDIHLNSTEEFTIETNEDDSIMAFTLSGDAIISEEHIPEKTAVKFGQGSSITFKATDHKAQILFMSSKALHEPVAWAGPIVMNTEEELQQAFYELKIGAFIQDRMDFEVE